MPDFSILRSGPSAEEVEAAAWAVYPSDTVPEGADRQRWEAVARKAMTEALAAARPHDPLHAVVDELLAAVEIGERLHISLVTRVGETEGHDRATCPWCVNRDALTAKLDSLRGEGA
jgi:hypothetical protein